ncbi:MAG: hypothetical protein CL846_05040 [Crocinitomicaceae bacterium]|nr:hypothetical protein [Crocinitomicaceae bacterium]|tara:strand:+ start:3334 stop:5031 length:1698 start_codon:yes stop_codon:yes gene_type:complete
MRVSFLLNLIIFLTTILFITSCNQPTIQKEKLSCNKLISEINTTQEFKFFFDNDTIITQADKNEEFYSFKCKNGKRIYRKKKFRLYPLKNNESIKKAELIIHVNNELKENKLIGVFSKIVNLNNESYLFQEEIGKRIIESNQRREGIILKIQNKDSYIFIESTKREAFSSSIDLSIQNFINQNILNECYIDKISTIKFISIIKKHLGNVNPNYFYLNPITNKAEPILAGLTNFKINKSKNIIVEECQSDSNFLTYFNKDQNNNFLFLKNDISVIESKLTIPDGYVIKINAGQQIDIINYASVISFSPIECKGTVDNKIHIFSSDSTGQGIHILQKNESSIIDHLVFSNQNSFSKRTKVSSWLLPSALTFYGGEVTINNSEFRDLYSEDAINTFRNKYSFSNSTIENTFSDAFDADFSFGSINNCSFINCGNDAVDISGGELDLNYSHFSVVKDKAISAGEESIMHVNNCTIEKSSLGIISKDLSKVNASNSSISNCEIAYCAFQKKGEFGPGSIVSTNNIESNCKKTHLIEFKSELSLNDSIINEFEYNVIDYLYGNIYGKATVK